MSDDLKEKPEIMAKVIEFATKQLEAQERKRKKAEEKLAKSESKKVALLKAKKAGEEGADAIVVADIKRIAKWVSDLSLDYEPRSHAFKFMGRSRSPSFMGRVIHRAVGDEYMLPQGAAELATYLYADVCRDAYIGRLRDEVRLGGQPGDALNAFLKFLLQREPSKLEVVAFEQFIWQIKRRIHGKPTEWEIMPLFTGGQGWGKTRHLQRLWASIPSLPTFVAKGQRFKIFDDDFGRAIFNQCFIIPFEEMSGARRQDIETLKMFITEDEVQARIMRAEQFQVMKLNATFYGTSNLPGGASLSDSTGMRRFFEFRCPDIKFTAAIHEPIVKALDIKGVWDCVDATQDESPARDYVQELSGEAERAFSKSGAIHDFWEDRIEQGDGVLSRSEVWDALVGWLKDQTGYTEKLKRNQVDDYVRKMFGHSRVKITNAGPLYEGFRFKK